MTETMDNTTTTTTTTSWSSLSWLSLWQLQEEDSLLFVVSLISTLTSVLLLLLSTLIDLLLLCTLNVRRQITKSRGYFGLLNVFLLLHWLYFLVLGLSWSAMSIFGDEVQLGWTLMLMDCPISIMGVSILVLCLMTIDCRLEDSKSNDKDQNAFWSCCRMFSCLFSLMLGILVLVAIILVKHPQVMARYLGKSLWPEPSDVGLLSIHALQLLLFAFLPAFVLVIVGTVNWVSDANSTRAIATPHRLSRQLDHCLLPVSILVLLLLTTKVILELSYCLDVFDSVDQLDVVQALTLIVSLALSVVFFCYDLVILCVTAEDLCCTTNPDR